MLLKFQEHFFIWRPTGIKLGTDSFLVQIPKNDFNYNFKCQNLPLPCILLPGLEA